jgi:microcompartment protein CcmL/EutN
VYPALALIEVSSIARGMVVTDACVKKAEVRLLASKPISPGRYITLFWGSVAEVEEAYREGLAVAGETLDDQLFLPGAYEGLLEAILAVSQLPSVDALGIIETFTVGSALLSADAACKAALVQLLELRLATGIGGKSYYIVTGELHDVEAAVEAGTAILSSGQLRQSEIIAHPAPDFTEFVW